MDVDKTDLRMVPALGFALELQRVTKEIRFPEAIRTARQRFWGVRSAPPLQEYWREAARFARRRTPVLQTVACCAR